jgi:hypothetical protein
MACMKPHGAVALALTICYVLSPRLLSAQAITRIFTDPDGAFSFRYSNQLIDCEQKPQQSKQACVAFAGVCDQLIGEEENQTSKACFAYPRNKFTDSPTFASATFSVEVVDHDATKNSCLGGPPEDADKHGTAIIHGVSFAVFETGEGGMNQGTFVEVYRTFHGGKCYQLGIDTAGSADGVFDPPVKELSDSDWREINGTLEQARKSFRFLK